MPSCGLREYDSVAAVEGNRQAHKRTEHPAADEQAHDRGVLESDLEHENVHCQAAGCPSAGKQGAERREGPLSLQPYDCQEYAGDHHDRAGYRHATIEAVHSYSPFRLAPHDLQKRAAARICCPQLGQKTSELASDCSATTAVSTCGCDGSTAGGG